MRKKSKKDQVYFKNVCFKRVSRKFFLILYSGCLKLFFRWNTKSFPWSFFEKSIFNFEKSIFPVFLENKAGYEKVNWAQLFFGKIFTKMPLEYLWISFSFLEKLEFWILRRKKLVFQLYTREKSTRDKVFFKNIICFKYASRFFFSFCI